MAPSGLTRVPDYCLAVRKALKKHYGNVEHLLDDSHMEKCLVQQLIKGLTPFPFKTVFENLFKNKKLKKFEPLFQQLNTKNIQWERDGLLKRKRLEPDLGSSSAPKRNGKSPRRAGGFKHSGGNSQHVQNGGPNRGENKHGSKPKEKGTWQGVNKRRAENNPPPPRNIQCQAKS